MTGPALLQRLHQQAGHYDVPIMVDTVTCLERRGERFVTAVAGKSIEADHVLLATGVCDVGNQDGAWTAAIRKGAIRLCPICDAFEITGKKVGLLARGSQAAHHALFLRTYTAGLTLVRIDVETPLPEDERAALAAAGVVVIEDPAPTLTIDENDMPHLSTRAGVLQFDSIYPMFGSQPRSDLAAALGATCDADGNLLVDAHQCTSVPGLYAAGDLVTGLNQISVAVGHAAVAATAIHNRAAPRFAR